MMQYYLPPVAPISSLKNSNVLNLSVLKRVAFGFLLFFCWQTFSHTTKSIFSENKLSIEVGHSPKAVVTPTTGPTHNKYVVGYYAQWAIYARDFNVSDIEAEHLTHLMYAFYDTLFDEGTETGSINSLDDYADYGHNEDPGITHSSELTGNMGAIQLLKEEHPHLKVLISLGGWTKSMNFPALARSENGRNTLAQAMVDFINTYPFVDGFDIDWGFPVEGGIEGQPHFADDHKNLVLLLKAMRAAFDTAFPG
jgi:GH18 family chitinase